MKKSYYIIAVAVAALVIFSVNWATSNKELKLKEKYNELVDTRIDNNGYWKEMARQGLAELNPERTPAPAIYTGSRIDANSVRTLDSPDVPVTTENSTQSENSVFVDPNQPQTVLNSNNSTQNPVGSLYGANDFYSFDAGENWEGEVQGAGGFNSGDPSTAISLSGRWYVGYIATSGGQGVSYSDDQGETWTSKLVASGGSGLLDKNHLWIDNSPSSPYEGNLYDAWTPFGSTFDSEIALAYSSDDGESWSSPVNLSAAVSAGSHNQGVNLSTGPNGEVYAVWSIYDSWPSDESAIGLARSYDGGETWEDGTRVIEDIRGVRSTETSKNMRVNSFPVAAVDISNGPNSGNIYIVWANVGVPGINAGSDIDVYMIRSSDDGDTWSEPIRVNQDPSGMGKEHYFPWITCDPANGALSVIFYDDRNVNSTQCEVFCANSYDAGETWEDFKVSDVAFTPSPIPGLAGGYFGDYLGISANGGWVYPVWTDNRSGTAMTYTSPYQTNPLPAPYDLEALVSFESGEAVMDWEFDGGEGFEHFIIYLDGNEIATTNDQEFTHNLPDYGIYQMGVTAYFGEDGESIMASTSIQWGDAHIAVDPAEINETLLQGETSTHFVTIENTGELELEFNISPYIQSDNREVLNYCDAGSATWDDEYIQKVVVGDINNSSGSVSGGYQDFTDLSTLMSAGSTYEIEVTNGSTQWAQDECGIWIDWNQNEDFTDDEPITVNGSPGVGPYTASITPPPGAMGGETRMRIRITYSKTPEPCGIDSYGEVEDYTIMVSNWLQIDQYSGNIPAGENMIIEVTLDAGELDLGDYYAELQIANNDPLLPEVVVPINLTVSDYTVIANAIPAEMCNTGESVQLNATPVGGSGEYTYSWTSNPEGFTSTEQNPVFGPLSETTTFMVEMDDGTNVANDEVTVTVHPLPEVSLGDDVVICTGEEHTFDAGAGFVSYLWQDGSDGQSFTADTTGIYWVEVSNENDCSKRDSVMLTVAEYPVVNLGPDTIICAHMEMTLDAGAGENYSYLWSVEGATSKEILVDSAGTGLGDKMIWVEVSNYGMCATSDTINISFKDCTGIDEYLGSVDIKVYPNPTEGEFNLKLNPQKDMHLNISIINQLGEVIYSKKQIHLRGEYTENINLSEFANGLYTIILDNDEYRWTKQLILK